MSIIYQGNEGRSGERKKINECTYTEAAGRLTGDGPVVRGLTVKIRLFLLFPVA